MKKSNKHKKNTFWAGLLSFWLLITGVFVTNEYYPLRQVYEQLFPIQYKTYDQFGIKIPTQFQVHGIDVSHHQGSINWKMVKEMTDKDIKLDFAFIKATEGLTHTDSRFAYNWENSKKEQLIRGAYHYFKPHQKGEDQANHFIRHVNLEKGDFPPVIDVEEKGTIASATLMKGLLKFAKKIESHYGVKPIIYTYHDFYKLNFDDTFEDYTLWIAHYNVRKPNNNQWNFWQHSDKGRVSGINTPVDFNVYNRSLEEMKKGLVN